MHAWQTFKLRVFSKRRNDRNGTGWKGWTVIEQGELFRSWPVEVLSLKSARLWFRSAALKCFHPWTLCSSIPASSRSCFRAASTVLCRAHYPESIVLQTPERIFGMIGLTARSEFYQQFAQFAIDFCVRDHARLPPQQARDRVARQQRFVRRLLTAALPDCDRVKSAPNFVRRHFKT